MDKRFLTNQECVLAVGKMREAIVRSYLVIMSDGPVRVYGVPRGGISVAYLCAADPRFIVCDDPKSADVIVDDIVDSGTTKNRYVELYHSPFFSLAEYLDPVRKENEWLVFPWEVKDGVDTSADDIVIRLLEFIGEDPNREGLLETPKRVLSSWKEMTEGYSQDAGTILTKDFDGGEYDQVIALPFIEFFSVCEHHLLPFFGVAHVGYLPGEGKRSRVVGISKLARLVDCFSRRLQIQERLSIQIADALEEHLKPRGVAVVIQAKHLCMACRGVEKHRSVMVTSAMRGVFLTQAPARQEFLKLIELSSFTSDK